MNSLSLRFIEALVVGDEELEVLVRVFDLSDFIFVIDEVPKRVSTAT